MGWWDCGFVGNGRGKLLPPEAVSHPLINPPTNSPLFSHQPTIQPTNSHCYAANRPSGIHTGVAPFIALMH
jgi:hypothetical protein